MATLQDLFNEIQADSRISNPPTFEDFQSKMEDPAYAERVNEILGRTGYDVNAYEGLKKKEESMVESAPLSQSESEQPSETTEPTQTVGTEPTEEVVTKQVIEKPVFSAPAPINTFSPFKKKKPQETKEELAAKAVPFDDSYNVSMGYFNPTTNKVEVLVEPKEEGSYPYTQVVDAGDPWFESVKKSFPGMAMYGDEKEWKTASAQKMAKEENVVPPTTIGALPMTPVPISGKKATRLGRVIQKTFGWDDARLEQFYEDQEKRKANRTPMEVWSSDFVKYLKGSRDMAEIQQAKERVKQENLDNAIKTKQDYELSFSNGRLIGRNGTDDFNAILEEYNTNPDAAYAKFSDLRKDITLDYFDAEEKKLSGGSVMVGGLPEEYGGVVKELRSNLVGKDVDQIRYERSKYEKLIQDERNGVDLDRRDEEFLRTQEAKALGVYSNLIGADVTILTSTKEYEKASQSLTRTNYKLLQAQKRLQELGYDIAGKAIEEQGKVLTQQQIEAKKYANEMTALNDDYEKFTTPLTSRQEVINKRIEELQAKGDVSREEEAEYSALVEEFNAINEQINEKTLNYTSTWSKAQENYNKYYTEANSLYDTIKEQEKKISDPEVQALVKIINNSKDEQNFIINETGVDATAISDLITTSNKIDALGKLNQRSLQHEESSVNRFDDIRERKKMELYLHMFGKVSELTPGSTITNAGLELTKGAIGTAYKMASGLVFSPVYIANLFAADDEYSTMDRVTETLADASSVLDPFTTVRTDADMVDKILNATGGAAVQMFAMASGSGMLAEAGLGAVTAQTIATVASTFPINYQENINAGMNPMDARNLALLNTTTDVLLEGIYGDAEIYKAIKASRKNLIREGVALGKSVDEIATEFYKSLPKEVADKVKDFGVRAVAITEGALKNTVEEFSQAGVQNISNRAYNYINDGSVAETKFSGEDAILTAVPSLILGGAGNAAIDLSSTQSRDALSEQILYVAANQPSFLSEIESQASEFYNENKKGLEEISKVAKESQKLPGYAQLDANLKAHVLSETIRKKNLESAMKNFGLEDPKTKEEIANIDTEIKQILAGEKTSTINETPQENAIQEPSATEVLPGQPKETGEAGSERKGVEPVLEGQGATQEVGKEEIVATPQEQKEPEAMQTDIDQVQQSTGTVINLNEDGTLTINAPQKGGQSKKEAAIENAKQELTSLGYNVESKVTQPTQQQTEVSEEEVSPLKDVESTANALFKFPKPKMFDKIANLLGGKKFVNSRRRKSKGDDEVSRQQEIDDIVNIRPTSRIKIKGDEIIFKDGNSLYDKLISDGFNESEAFRIIDEVQSLFPPKSTEKYPDSFKETNVEDIFSIVQEENFARHINKILNEQEAKKHFEEVEKRIAGLAQYDEVGITPKSIDFLNKTLSSIKSGEAFVFTNNQLSDLGITKQKTKDNLDAFDISEAYHKAKADGSNPELVEAVESLLAESKPKFQLNLNNSLSEEERSEVESLFEESSNNPENTPSEVFNIDEDLSNNIPFSEIKIDTNDGREESTLMSKMRIPLNFIFGKRVGLGMSDTLTTGEREVDVMDSKTGKIKKEKIREEGGIGYPFKTLLDLLNGKSKPNQKHFGWAAVGKGAASAMVNAAKKASKITGKELKELYIKNLGLDKNQISILNKTISDNEEFGLVTIYKMGDEGIRSNEAFTREAFRMIETMLSEEEKQKFFELAEDRLNNLVWEEKEKYLPLIASAKNFIELENILHGKDSKLSLGVKASIMQKVFLSTESTESKENVNPIGSLLKEKGITMESISRNIEEPIMSGVQKGNPVILVAIKTNVNTDTQITEDVKRERHNNYPFGVEGFPIGVFNETTQMHQLSPEMMDTFVKTSTTQETQAKKSRKKQRVVVYQNQNGEFLAEQGTGVDKLPVKDKAGNVISANSREGLIKKLTDLGYSFSPEFINAPYAPTINGTTYNNLLQKAKKGLIDIFLTPKMTSQQQVVSLLQKAFPGVVVNMTEKDFNEKEKQLKSEGNSAQLLNKNQKIYGFIYKGVIYINPQFINNNTIIHEYGHIWNLVAQKQFPEIHKKGIELIQNSEYVDRVLSDSSYQKVMKNIFGDDIFIKDKSTKKLTLNTESQNYELASKYLSDEALSTAIGDKGELFLNEAQKRNFLDWIKELFKAIKNVIGFKSITPEQLSDMTLSDFTNAVIKDLLGGKKISDITSEDLKDLETKFQIDIDAEESPLYQRRTKKDVPFVADSEIKNLVQDGKGLERERDILNKGYKLKKGEVVTSRINLNFLRFTGIPALSIHKGTLGEVLTYAGSITLKDVTFPVQQGAREAIAKEAAEKNTQGGSKKTSMAGGKGSYVEVEPNFDGVELSFNPAAGHLFVDSEGRAIMSAEEVTFLGFKAYARGKISYFEDFEDPRSSKYTAPSQTKFAKTKEELVNMADDVQTGNTTVEEVGVPEVAPEVVAEAITAFSDAIENGSTIEEATEEVAIVLENSAEGGPRKVTPPSEKTEPISTNKKEEKPKAEKKEKVEGPILSDSETIVAFTVAGNAKSIMDTTGVPQADAVKEAVLEITNGDQESADRYLAQEGVKEAINNKIKQIKAKTERELEAASPKITMSERKLLLERVKAEIKAALEGRKEGKKEGVDQAKEQAQKTIDALNKKLEEGKITKQELQDRIKELGYTIRWEAGVARLAGEKAGKSMGKKFGEFVGYFKGLKAGRTEQRGLGALVSDYIKDVIDSEFGKKGSISPATLKSIARRAATISNQKQLDAFVSYLDKVIANRRLAEGLNEIKKLQKKLLNKVGYQYTSNMKMFAKFDMFTADGDLAFDMNTLEEYLDALRDLTSDRVPKIGKMMELFDEMYDINLQNQPAPKTAIDSLNEWQVAVNKLFNTAKDIIVENNGVVDLAESFQNYRSFKSNVKKYTNALDELLVTGMISESDYERMFNDVIEKSAVTDTYATEFQDQIDELKNILVQGITDKSGYGFMDSIKDWLSNSPNTFTENQKKLIDQLMRAKPDNLMTLSLEDLDLLNQVTAQIAEAGFVDEKNLRTLLDRAEIRGNEVGKSLVEQSQKVRNKYSNPKNGYIKMMRDTLGKSVVFWESRLGMKENGAFRKHLVDPIVRAINGWEKDTQRILKDYQKKVEGLRSKNILKNAPGIGKLINRTKIEKFKLTTDGNLAPDGTIKVSKDAYDRVMIGVVGHILDNAWNAKQKKKTVNDWLGKQMLSATERNKMQNEDVNELDIVNNVYNDLKKMFPDGKGGLDHMAVLEAFESDPTSILTSSQLEYYNVVRSTLQEAGEYINSASGMRNQQHELNPYYMPRQSIGTGKAALTSTDISYNKNVGAAIRSGASYQRVLQVPVEAIRYNVDRLVMTNVNEGLRDYYLTEAKRYVKEVFSNAQENASSDEVVMLNNLKQLSDTIAPFALEKSESTFGLSKLMGKFFVDALIGIVRTPIEFTTNLIAYALGNRSSKSITLPFTPKEKQETEKLLSEFDSSVQFTGMEKKVKLRGDKGIDGYLDRESNFGLINKFLNNVTGFMRKGEWKSQFEREFQNNTGEKFNYEKHFVKEKAKYYDEMSKAASDADFRMRRIMKGGNKAEQRQFIEWLPLVKQARISADSKMAPFVGMFSGFINHDADNFFLGLRKAVTRGEIKDGLTQSLGAYSRLALYPVLMVIGKAVANLNLGDDDEKEEAQETLDSLKTAQGWIDMATFSAKQVAATLVGGKYAAGGKVVGSLLLDAAYTISGMNGDRKQQRLIEDTMRELYFVDPIDFYNLPSEKDDIALQISANLEPIIGMAINAVADFTKDVQNKGREQVTLYDIYEWTQQTEEGKQWMYMVNSIATLGQTLTVALTPGAIPFIDDYVRWAEDKLSQKEPNENTLYKTPSGEVIDMRDLFLDDSQRIPINTPGISTRERDKYSILATEKFNKAIEKEGKSLMDLFADEKYLQMDYLFNKAKYDAGSELGFPTERWSETEGEMVSGEPIPPSERDNLPESEVTLEKLHQQIIKGKQLSFVQNIKEKRKVEDYMFKEFDKNPNMKNDYKNATIGGKLGIREYFKAKYLYDKYKLTEPPTPSNYFIKEKGEIKQVESTPAEKN